MVSCRVCKTSFEAGSYRDELCPGCGALVPVSVRLCPCCTLPFGQREVDGLVIDECARCGGVFLDHQTQRRVFSNDVVAHAVIAALSQNAKGLAPFSGRPALACPACTEPMQRRLSDEGSGVVFDVCSVHGTFFDGGELPAVVAFQRGVAERRAADRANANTRYAGEGNGPSVPRRLLLPIVYLGAIVFLVLSKAC